MVRKGRVRWKKNGWEWYSRGGRMDGKGRVGRMDGKDRVGWMDGKGRGK